MSPRDEVGAIVLIGGPNAAEGIAFPEVRERHHKSVSPYTSFSRDLKRTVSIPFPNISGSGTPIAVPSKDASCHQLLQEVAQTLISDAWSL